MNRLDSNTPLDHFIGAYGPRWTTGLLSDHVEAFVAAGGVVRNTASGSGAKWALVDSKAYPVLCSDIVEVHTEDGRMSARCGEVATRRGACETHAAEYDAYAAMTEAQRAFRERQMDGVR